MRRLDSPPPHKLVYGAQLLGQLGSGIESPLSSPKRPLMTGSGQGQRQSGKVQQREQYSLSQQSPCLHSLSD